MATLGNKRKLAAVSRETPESTRHSRAQNTLDPESTQDYISHFSEEIEGRVTRKLSKEFSRTESRILAALSKLDEFLLNPQVRTCSVAVPGTSRNNNSENRETIGDRSSDHPCPEVRYSSHHSGHLNSPEAEEYPHMVTGATREIRRYPHMVTGATREIRRYPHMVTGGQEEFRNRSHMKRGTQKESPYCSTCNSSGKKRRRAPQVSHNFAVGIPQRQLKQTRFCWPFNNWRRVIQAISTTTTTESRNCPNPSQLQCPQLMENQRNSNCLKICFKRVLPSTIN